MYPNNLYYPYQIARNIPHMNIARPLTNSFPMIGTRPGLFSRLGNSLSAIKSINWSNIINNTSRTLGVINQAIPIVKQTGPMLHNMRSMLKVASVFRDETSNKKNTNKKETVTNNLNSNTNIETKKEIKTTDDSLPNFFI